MYTCAVSLCKGEDWVVGVGIDGGWVGDFWYGVLLSRGDKECWMPPCVNLPNLVPSLAPSRKGGGLRDADHSTYRRLVRSHFTADVSGNLLQVFTHTLSYQQPEHACPSGAEWTWGAPAI